MILPDLASHCKWSELLFAKDAEMQIDDPIPGFTVEEFAQMVSGLVFEFRNASCASASYAELALEKLEPSHPGFQFVTEAHRMGMRSFNLAQDFTKEVIRRRKAQEGT